MPRRKRTADQDGRRAKLSKVENYEETLVISDSDHEEEEQCAVKSSTRASRWRQRGNDSQLQEMTEDEMLNLAMRLSAQEANSAAQRQHLEDNDIQKAIVESLNDRSVKSSVRWHETTSSSAQQQQSEAKVKSLLRRKLSYPSQGGALHGKESPAALDGENKRETTSPLPEMHDLSRTTTPHHSSSNSALLSGPHAASQKTHDLNQVKDQITPNENVKADSERAPNTQSWHGFASHMVLHLTDDEDDGSEEVHSPSPVFHQETVSQPAQNKLSPTQPCIPQASVTPSPSTKDSQMSQPALEEDLRTSRGPAFKHSDCKRPHTAVGKGDCTVSYYWGVPFCPHGQNPDDYTHVIMCQLEVYEKTLKEAQRELLRKAEWSPPVLPGASERPCGTRRWKRHRDLQMSEDEEEKEEEEEEGEKENSRIEVEGEEENREESVVGSEEAAKVGQCETYVVLPSPGTEDEVQQKSPFFSQVEPTPGSKHFRKDASDDDQKQLPDEQEEEDAQNHEGYEEETTVCPETQMTESSTPELMETSPDRPTQPQSRVDSELMEGEGGAPVAEEVVMEQDSVPAEAAPTDSQRMECPMCSKLFPLSRIEVHAAFCDGEAEDQDLKEEQSPVVSLRKRTRKDVTEETRHRSGNRSAKMEKCFLCLGFFPPQEYPEHVDLCLKKRDSKTNQENGLLSALDQTERRQIGSDDAGPSDISIKSNCGLADPAVMGTSGESVECSAMTSAPSNAFAPLAEDTDCLIDSSKNSQRLSRKRKFKR